MSFSKVLANDRMYTYIFSFTDSIPVVTAIETADNNLLNLEKGTYLIKLKVFKTTDTKIPEFSIQIADPYLNINWNIADVSENEWITLSQEVNLDSAIVNSKFTITAYNNLGKGWGKGAFYIDDIRFEKKTVTAIAPGSNVRYSVYPNPFNKKLNIDAPKGSELTLFSLRGERLYNSVLRAPNTRLELANLAPGLYVLTLKYLGNSSSVKLFKYD